MVLGEMERNINGLGQNRVIRSAPDDGLSFDIVLLEAQAQMTASKDLLVSNPTTSRPEQRLGVASTKRLQLLEIPPKLVVDLLQFQQGLRLHQQSIASML